MEKLGCTCPYNIKKNYCYHLIVCRLNLFPPHSAWESRNPHPRGHILFQKFRFKKIYKYSSFSVRFMVFNTIYSSFKLICDHTPLLSLRKDLLGTIHTTVGKASRCVPATGASVSCFKAARKLLMPKLAISPSPFWPFCL